MCHFSKWMLENEGSTKNRVFMVQKQDCAHISECNFKEKHLINHVVHTNVAMHPIPEENPLPRKRNKKVSSEKGALKIRAEDYSCIKEETLRREALEDPDCERFES